ncbi:MAG: rhodanese-like domain-containing protein [Nitrospirota bacterium]
MRKSLIVVFCLISALAFAPSVFASAGSMGPMARLCTFCHQAKKGVMRGFLENIALESGTIQMDFMSHKDVIKFNKDTKLKYVRDFKDIANYRNKGFRISYVEKNGEKIATVISRFDILRVLKDSEKLGRDEFKKLRNDPNVKVFDVRPPMKYKMGHIPGADLLPAPAFKKFVKKLPKDKSRPIVFYGVGGCLSPDASIKTKALGYKDVRIYTGGFPDWSKNEYGVVAPDWLKMAIAKDMPHVLIDLRPASVVKKGHIKGAVGIEYSKLDSKRSQFPEKKNAPIIFYGDNSKKAAAKAVKWGYRAVRILPMDFQKWQKAGNPVAKDKAKIVITYVPKTPEGAISGEEFEKIAARTPDNMLLVDVRNPDEFKSQTIQGAINIPLGRLAQRLGELDKSKELIFYCNTGIRAEMSRNIASKKGVKNRYLNASLIVRDGKVTVEEH